MGQYIIIAGGHPFVVLRNHSLDAVFLPVPHLSLISISRGFLDGWIHREEEGQPMVSGFTVASNQTRGGRGKSCLKGQSIDPAFLAENPSQKTNREPTIELSVKHRPWGVTTSDILSPHKLEVRTQIGIKTVILVFLHVVLCALCTIFYQTILEYYDWL